MALSPGGARSTLGAVHRKVRRAAELMWPDADARRFIRNNREVWRGWAPRGSDRVVLVDFYGASETNIARSYFLNVLARRHHAVIRSFGPPSRLPARALHEVYRSFNTTGHITTSLTRSQAERVDALGRDVTPKIRTKQDLLDLHVLGIWVGVDVYETYLRRDNQPTAALDDPRLHARLREGIGLVVFWQDYFASHDVRAVVVSHDCYLRYNVVSKVAYAARVPVYYPNVRGMARGDRPYVLAEYFARYREMFARLAPGDRREAIAWAQSRMARRLSGEIVDMPYATKSAFRGAGTEARIVRESPNPKVLVCVPCFTDNPHGCSGFLFVDFYEWLQSVGSIARRTSYDWYLKTHPDPLPITLDAVRVFLGEHPEITLVPPETSHHQLAREGIQVVLTPYGSVGHEYPALGVQVVNAGYNTHAAYDFTWTPKSLDEYETWLLNLAGLRREIDLDALYEYYYMHHGYTIVDDLVFVSYRQALEDLTTAERLGSRVYRYFLDQLTPARHRRIIERMDEFIESGKPYYFVRGPE